MTRLTCNRDPRQLSCTTWSYTLLFTGALLLACGGANDGAPGEASDSAVVEDVSAPSLDRPHPVHPPHPAHPQNPASPAPDPLPPQPSDPLPPPTSDPAPILPVLEPAPPAGPTVSVAFADALPAGTFTTLSSAVIYSTPEIYVVADWTNVTADQSERLTLWTPRGMVYYAPEISFAETSTSVVHVTVLPDGTRRVVFTLPIWGTPIDGYAMVGTWTATATLVNGSTTGSAAIQLN